MPKDRRTQIVEGLINGIRGFTDIQAERSKIMGDLIINQIKAKDNFLYKLREIQASKQLNPLEQEKLSNLKLLREKYGQQEGGGMGVDAQTDIMGRAGQPTMRLGSEGPIPHYRTGDEMKDFILNQINEKRARKFPLSKLELAKEQEFKAPIVTETKKYQGELAKLGYEIRTDPQLSPEKNLENMRNVYANVMEKQQQPIVDATGKVIGYRPKGAVFAPRTGITKTSAMGILADPVKSQQLQSQFPELYQEVLSVAKEEGSPEGTEEISVGKIRVRIKESGETGTIEEKEFDPEVYEKI